MRVAVWRPAVPWSLEAGEVKCASVAHFLLGCGELIFEMASQTTGVVRSHDASGCWVSFWLWAPPQVQVFWAKSVRSWAQPKCGAQRNGQTARTALLSTGFSPLGLQTGVGLGSDVGLPVN